MTAELLIIQDGNSWLVGRGLFSRPEISLNPFRRLVVQTFADEYLGTANFNHYNSFFRQPGMSSAQHSPGIGRRRIVRNFAIYPQPLPLLIPLRQRFRVHRGELRSFRGTRPAGNVQYTDRRRFVCLRPSGKVVSTAPLRVDGCSLVPARVLFNQNIYVKLSHGANIEGVV